MTLEHIIQQEADATADCGKPGQGDRRDRDFQTQSVQLRHSMELTPSRMAATSRDLCASVAL